MSVQQTAKPDKLLCWICSCEVTIYFESNYSGMRGKCTSCETNFPLE